MYALFETENGLYGQNCVFPGLNGQLGFSLGQMDREIFLIETDPITPLQISTISILSSYALDLLFLHHHRFSHDGCCYFCEIENWEIWWAEKMVVDVMGMMAKIENQ